MTIGTELEKALDELSYWHDQCMTRRNVHGGESASFVSAWQQLNARVVRVDHLRARTASSTSHE